MITGKKSLRTKNPQFVIDNNGKKLAVLVPLRDYEKLLDDSDEIECIRAYDKIKDRKLEFIPADEMFKAVERKRKLN